MKWKNGSIPGSGTEQSGGWQDIFWLHVPLYLIINCHRLLHVAKINYIFDNKAKHTRKR
jgi:hypothetical protein